MGVALKLAINYLKNNKKRTFIISLCILISTILITTILLFLDSYKGYRITVERNNSNWEVSYNGITYEEACTIEKHSNVKEISVMREIGSAKSIDEGRNLKYTIIGFDKNAIKNLIKNNLMQGRLPENSTEVVCMNGDYKIGDKLIQTLENGENKEYIVVGTVFYSDFIDSFQVITLLDRAELNNTDTVNITVLSNNIKQIYDDYFDIYYQLSSYRNQNGSSLENMTRYNENLLEYEGVLDYVSNFQKGIYAIEGIFIGIVVISSMIFIYSVVNISIIERKKYFGILKSIGTTSKQMRRSIRAELFIILFIVIPLGVLIGIGLDCLLITVVNNIFPDLSTSGDGFLRIFQVKEEMNVAIPFSTLGLSIIIVILATYLSSVVPIKKISRTQAINLIKQNREYVYIKKRKSKEKIREKHIERKLAFKNIERYKSRYTAIIMSLVISITLIIVSNYYITNIVENAYRAEYNYEISLNYRIDKYGDLAEKIIDDIQEAKIADKIILNYTTTKSLLVPIEKISDEEKELGKKIYGGDYKLYPHFRALYTEDYTEVLDVSCLQVDVVELNKNALNNYFKKIGIDKLEDDECILVDYSNIKTKYYNSIKFTNYKDGDFLTIGNGSYDILEKNTNIKVKKVTNLLPSNLPSRISNTLIIVNRGVANKIYDRINGLEENEREFNADSISLWVKDIEEADNLVQQLKEKYNLTSDQTESEEFIEERSYEGNEDAIKLNLLINIFIYSFIGIITLVGIINMYNAINSSLENKKREIVRLVTIGMEEKQINKMIFLENAICCVLALILGIAIGALASYVLYFLNIDFTWYAFKIPWTSVIVSILGITLVTIISTIYLKKKIFVDDLMEVLRKEEI